MTTALAWIRKSKGSDDDIALEMQRKEVPTAGEELADDVDVLDLGVQTGFSTLSRTDDKMLDDLPEVQKAVEELRAGAYDYLVAVDDRRVCRDDYLRVIEYACAQGDCEIVYLSDDVETDDLAFDIQRRVEQKTKEEEIRKAKAAVEERQRRGMWQGGPPFGLQFDDAGEYLIPDDDFEDALEVFDRVDEETYAEIADDLGIGKGTVGRIRDRGREFYEARAN